MLKRSYIKSIMNQQLLKERYSHSYINIDKLYPRCTNFGSNNEYLVLKIYLDKFNQKVSREKDIGNLKAEIKRIEYAQCKTKSIDANGYISVIAIEISLISFIYSFLGKFQQSSNYANYAIYGLIVNYYIPLFTMYIMIAAITYSLISMVFKNQITKPIEEYIYANKIKILNKRINSLKGKK